MTVTTQGGHAGKIIVSLLQLLGRKALRASSDLVPIFKAPHEGSSLNSRNLFLQEKESIHF